MIARPVLRVMTAIVLWLCLPARLIAQPSVAPEYEVKAAYVFNFGKFVQFPAGPPGATFDLCIAGSDPFGAALTATVDGETINARAIRVRHLAALGDPRGCHILFVSRSLGPEVAGLLTTLAAAPVLTVSDLPGFVRRGGMVEFVTQAGKVRFEINLPAAQNAGLVLSSELLRVASAVIRK